MNRTETPTETIAQKLSSTRYPGFKRLAFAKNYSVSREGVVYSEKLNKILKPYIASSGYASVDLRTDFGKRVAYRVHRLVAFCYLPMKDGCTHVNHKDFNKANNAVENLEWVTTSENQQHARKGGRWQFSRIRTYSTVTYWVAQQIRLDFATLGLSIREMANAYQLSTDLISGIVSGKLYLKPDVSDFPSESQRLAAAVRVVEGAGL